jgi:hypothetical protein
MVFLLTDALAKSNSAELTFVKYVIIHGQVGVSSFNT